MYQCLSYATDLVYVEKIMCLCMCICKYVHMHYIYKYISVYLYKGISGICNMCTVNVYV